MWLDPMELVLAICLQPPKEEKGDGLGTSWRITVFFWNEKASHVSSASHMEDAWDAKVGWETVLSCCLDIWAAIAASNESQLNGICWRHWVPSARGVSMQLGSTSWETPESRSPMLIFVRLSAHSPADKEVPLLNFRSSYLHEGWNSLVKRKPQVYFEK